MLALKAAWKAREARRKIMVPARMQAGSVWTDVTLLNISSRGLLVHTQSPPARGAYIEIRRLSCVIVGRVVWAKDNSFGIRTQDVIDMDALLRDPASAQTPGSRPAPGSPAVERRVSADRNAAISAAHRLDRSRRISSTLQFAVLGTAGIAAAILLAGMVKDILATPLRAIEAHLSGPT